MGEPFIDALSVEVKNCILESELQILINGMLNNFALWISEVVCAVKDNIGSPMLTSQE